MQHLSDDYGAAVSTPGGPVTITYTYDSLYRLKAADYSTGDFYYYTYDAVGNRLTQDKTVGGQHSTTTYTYDAANRLQSVNGVTYTWDNNGNLLNDGVNTYTYDAANRLITPNGGPSAFGYSYNGLGNRLQQTVKGQTARYALDINTSLPDVLSDGSHTYTYGLGNLSQSTGTATDYFLGDALGSTRQLTGATGQIGLTESYEPFGNPVASAGTASSIFGYGEQQTDSYIKLIYLRSRMYDPASGRFLTKDSWQGNDTMPMSYNAWLYVAGNPINYTDPSGHCSSTGDDWCINHNPRDLTDWLVREMVADAQDARVDQIRQVNTAAHVGVGIGGLALGGGVACANPLIIAAGGWTVLVAGGAYGVGFWEFYGLVHDHGPFDVKHKIKEYLGQGITLGDQDDIEYSDTGNILYGFVGASIGYPDQILYVGAGIAEITDPAHDPVTAAKAGVDYVPYTGDKMPPYYGDTHGDHNAIAFGVTLYKSYGMGLTLTNFLTALSQYSSGLDRHQAAAWPVRADIANRWPYPVGYFYPTK